MKRFLFNAMVIAIAAIVCALGFTGGCDYRAVNSAKVNAINVSSQISVAGAAKKNPRLASELASGVAISTQDELKKFIRADNAGDDEIFNCDYGYLTADIELDWQGVGARQILAEGRTVDGNGYRVVLSDCDSGGGESVEGYAGEDFVDTMESNAYAEDCADSAKRQYGMFVDYNLGTIKNIEFVYESDSREIFNNSDGDASTYANYVGIICATNLGRIENCDLRASGSLTYKNTDGSISDKSVRKDDRFFTIFGGYAGRNCGIIVNVTAVYEDFYLDISTVADNTGAFASKISTDAKTFAGGIAGVMAFAQSDIDMQNVPECRNIVVIAQRTDLALTAESCSASVGAKGKTLSVGAAVVVGNSPYSYGVEGIVDNVVVDFDCSYSRSQSVPEKDFSRNAVVYCGGNTNVTILNLGNKENDLQTDSCDCGENGAQGWHNTSLGNYLDIGEGADVTVSVDGDGQRIDVKPGSGFVLGEAVFEKYIGNNLDRLSYENTPQNGVVEVYLLEDIRQNGYSQSVAAYQPRGDYYWRYSISAYRLAELEICADRQLIYNGSDYLGECITYASLDGSARGKADGRYLNLVGGGAKINRIEMPGEYSFTVEEAESGFAYIDKRQLIAVPYVEDGKIYNIRVEKGVVEPLETSGKWINHNPTFTLQGGIADAADGYVYRVNGSLPKSVCGLELVNRFDTLADGREYKITLTKNGIAVSEEYDFTLRYDATAPIISINNFAHPIDEYYTDNAVTFAVSDSASGVDRIEWNSCDVDGLITDSRILTPVDSGLYTQVISVGGLKQIKAIDAAGNVSIVEFYAKVDPRRPQLDIQAYYYENSFDGEDNAFREKKIFCGESDLTSAVYFDASMTEFSISGGNVMYSLDGGNSWEYYSETLMIQSSCRVIFKAVGNVKYVDSDGIERFVCEVGETYDVQVNVTEIEISAEDIEISGATKVFDGTDIFKGEIRYIGDDLAEQSLTFCVRYSDSNASDSILLLIVAISADDRVKVNSNMVGIYGTIEKASVKVRIHSKIKSYGEKNPQFTYEQSGMVEGREEQIMTLCSASKFSPVGEYVVGLDESARYVNYEVSLADPSAVAYLTVERAAVNSLEYDRNIFTGLDTLNVCNVEFIFGFLDKEGEYVALKAEFFKRNSSRSGLEYSKVEEICEAGIYRIVLNLPDKINGQDLNDFYFLTESAQSFEIEIVDARLFASSVVLEISNNNRVVAASVCHKFDVTSDFLGGALISIATAISAVVCLFFARHKIY